MADDADGEYADDVDRIAREYRRRRPVPKALLALMAFCLLTAAQQTWRTFASSRSSALVPEWLSTAGAVALWVPLAALALEQWRGRTVVTAHGVTVRGAVRTRSVAWADVHDIRVEPRRRDTHGLTPRSPAYLYATDGRRILLPRLDEWQLDDPYAEVAELRAAVALPDGGVGEAPWAEARVRWRAGHRTAWQRANLGAALVLAAMVVLWAGRALVTGTQGQPFLLLVCVPLASLAVPTALLHGWWEVPAGRG
ncbi:PH domain-containing protein [Streptomyces sp. NPDC052015]|uniref:PH domain-containing protein n=1 Tax=Streptomyces sp. NPDC052015 TaxID=3154755 RepID=UPI00343B4594